MTNPRLFTTSAVCALGAAILATTALQSTPAEARVQASAHTRASAHSAAHKVSFRISKELPGQQSSTSGGGGGGGGGGGKQVEVPQSKPGDGGRPVPPGGIPSGPSIPAGGGGKPTTTGPINPGSLPGNRPTEQTPTPPVVTGSNPGPIPPVLNPGKIPGTKQPPGPKPVPPPGTNAGGGSTGPNNPDYPGGNRPPIFTGYPTRAPLPPVTGSSPNSGYATSTITTHGHGVYAEVSAEGGDYAPCRLFKSNYDRTGNAYWLNRYRICLWQH